MVDPSEVLLKLGLSDTATDEERALVTTAIKAAEGAIRRYLRYDFEQKAHTEFYPQQSFQAQFSQGIWEISGDRAVMRQVAESATNELQLRHIPIRGDVTVYVDYDGRSGTATGAFAAETLKVQGTDFWPNYDMLDSAGLKVCHDGILRALGLWPTNPGTVKVVYTAGYSDNELRGVDTIIDATPIWEAVIDEAVARTRRMIVQKKTAVGMPAGTLTSESLGDYSYSVDPGSAANLSASRDLSPETKERLSDYVNYGWHLGS